VEGQFQLIVGLTKELEKISLEKKDLENALKQEVEAKNYALKSVIKYCEELIKSPLEISKPPFNNFEFKDEGDRKSMVKIENDIPGTPEKEKTDLIVGPVRPEKSGIIGDPPMPSNPKDQ